MSCVCRGQSERSCSGVECPGERSRAVPMTAGSAALLRTEVRSRPSKFLLQATNYLPVRFEAENPSGDPLAVCHSNTPDNPADVWDSRWR